MADNQDHKYIFYSKVAWAIYALIAVILAAVLVLFVAKDNEEMFFYGAMTPAAFYVFRPGDRSLGKLIFKFTGVSQATDQK